MLREEIKEIIERVVILPLTATNDSDDVLQICEVISKLPTRVRERVLDEVDFYLMPGVLGQTEKMFCPSHNEDKVQWSIFLNFNEVRNDKRKRTTIAHEIAHFILRHDTGRAKRHDSAERKADDLCEKWGFGRAYKNYDQFRIAPRRKSKTLKK
jgi:hypothetical protein